MNTPTFDLPSRSVAVVLGTRPEIIKLGHVIGLLGSAVNVIHTGQHYDSGLSDSFLETFEVAEPTVYLGVGGKTRGDQIGTVVSALDAYLGETRPEVVVVQGDTNASLGGAIAANAREIPLVHVEAGLRSRDRRMPEEHNRVLTDHLADLLCAPTSVSEKNLLEEGISRDRIVVTGNTVVEAVLKLMPSAESRQSILSDYGLEPGRFVLSTFHRPENVDDPARFASIAEELAALPFPVVLPLHPRSRERALEFGMADKLEALTVVDPIGYQEFLGLGAESAFLVSDSGGVQEEVSVYKKPVVVVRRSTERPEVLGTFAELVEPGGIVDVVKRWLSDLDSLQQNLDALASPYGDGSASTQIVKKIQEMLSRG